MDAGRGAAREAAYLLYDGDMTAQIKAQMKATASARAAPAGAARALTFIPLKTHSAYSLLEGALPIGKLAKLADQHGFPALGLTDTGNLYGALEFSEKMAGAGLQPIVGVSLAVQFEKPAAPVPAAPQARPAAAREEKLALFAMDEQGFAHLMKIVSRAHLGAGDGETPNISFEFLRDHAAGLIALTGGPDGPIDSTIRDGRPAVARERLEVLRETFGNRLYVELQRYGVPGESGAEAELLSLAYDLEIPIVATNETYFATPGDYEAHDALLCIAEGRTLIEDDRRRVTPNHCFKSAADMERLFADLPEALANTVEIAKRCAFRPLGKKPILPRYVQAASGGDAEALAAEAAELDAQARAGLAARLAENPLAEGFTREDYEKRLAFEIGVITKMKFPGYFLIVADFIKWAKANDVPVGPGRGSGAGSVAAWALTITDLDPLRFGLLFERFLNPERVSMPDFDIDFCQDRRDRVIRYVQEKYGSDRVAQIITHGKLQARAVLRDVGRVLQMPYGQVDRLCKLVPNNPANPTTLPEAIAGEPKFKEAAEAEPVVARLLEIAQKLEGLYRHASTHAAGMVIGDRPLEQLVPLTRDPKTGTPITQYNWKMVEAAGLVKFDFLGLKTLTVLSKAVRLIARRGVALDLARLPLDNKKSYELLAKADTVGVFQLESTGMRDSLKRLKPDRFEDIIAMVALYRPGPMDNIPAYINRKHGLEDVDCLHPMLNEVLAETHGVIIYQEQVMRIAQVMAGYSLGEADLLRRAMGKKDKAEMARQQARFVEGAVKNGVKKEQAAYIFELVDKFAGYGFNKSHAAAYALVSYHTAYLKANYREEFLAASMTLDMDNTDKLALFAGEARKSRIRVLPPCVNASEVDFLAEPGAIRYSLAALKNIGAGAVGTIVAAREEKGPFKSLADFASRFDAKALNKRGLETLSAAGAFDALEPNRALAHGNVEGLIALANRVSSDAKAGTTDLFAGGSAAPKLDLRKVQPWTPVDRLRHEFDAVGFYLSGHPLDQYESALKKLGVLRFTDFEAAAAKGVRGGRLAGIVVSSRERKSQKGNKYAFAMFSDMTGQFEAIIFSDTLEDCRDLLEAGTPVVVTVEAERDGETLKLRVQGLEALDKAAAGVRRGLRIVLDRRMVESGAADLGGLKSRLKPGGKGEVRLALHIGERRCEMEFLIPGGFDISPAQAGALSVVPGVVDVVET